MLRIKDWSAHFENNRTRELKRLDWVPIPNRMDGDGYTELVDHENGAAHLGAWIAIVQIASKCDVRGTLSREGARPHDCRSLARISRIPVSVFEEAIPRLLRIGWLEDTDANIEPNQQDTESPQDDARIPQDGAAIPQDVALNGREGKGIERNGRESDTPPLTNQDLKPQLVVSQKTVSFDTAEGFERFKAKYPVQTGIDLACQWYVSEIHRSKDPVSLDASIHEGLDRWLASAKWRNKDTGELELVYIPAMHTFLGYPTPNKPATRMYLDHPPAYKPTRQQASANEPQPIDPDKFAAYAERERAKQRAAKAGVA